MTFSGQKTGRSPNDKRIVSSEEYNDKIWFGEHSPNISMTKDEYKINRVVVSTYQAVSGAGKTAMDELFNQTKGVFVHDQAKPEQFTKKIPLTDTVSLPNAP